MDGGQAINVKYRITFSGLNESMFAYTRANRSIMDIIVGVLAIALAFLQFYVSGLNSLGFGLLAIGFFILFRGYVFVASFLLYRRYRDIYKENFEVTIDEEGIHAKTGTLDATRSWEGYQMVIESDKSFIFVYAKMGFFAIPKEALNSQTEKELRGLIRNKIANFRSLVS